jgi:hypothetical protein
VNRLARALAELDRINGEDPRVDLVGERAEPKELLYSRRMSETLAEFAPDASDELVFATRAQHVGRWRIPRDRYPEGRDGYRQWRTELMGLHARIAGDVLREVGYDEPVVARVGQLLRKQGIKRDLEVQTLEDVACLVFLRWYFDEFAAEHDDDKLVDILRKTWLKMSPRGRAAAGGLELGERGTRLLGRALAEAG